MTTVSRPPGTRTQLVLPFFAGLPPPWQLALQPPPPPPAAAPLGAVPLPLAPGVQPLVARPAWLLLNLLHELRAQWNAAGLPPFAGAPPGGSADHRP